VQLQVDKVVVVTALPPFNTVHTLLVSSGFVSPSWSLIPIWAVRSKDLFAL